MIEAKYYETLDNLKVRCNLCPNYCLIAGGDYGICRGRLNLEGVLYAVNYGKTVSISVDPIEKKPLYHYYPNSNILSLGCNNCNLNCDFCQNFTISQLETNTVEIPPSKLIEICLKHNVNSVAFTYSEPITWYEYVLDCAILLKSHNIRTVLVSNGYINERPLAELLPNIDAMNIDIKAMSEDFYRKIVQGHLKPVLNAIQMVYDHCHLEVTNLLIPQENDDIESIDNLVDFLASVSEDIPLHFSRYFPNYRRNTPPTSHKTMQIAKERAVRKLHYVYLGNILSDKEANTYCPNCTTLLIERHNFNVAVRNLTDNRCRNCQKIIYGRF